MKLFLQAGVCLAALCLTACAELQPVVSREQIDFEIAGRIAVRYRDEAASANVAWRHARDADELLLTTPIGSSLARVVRNGRKVATLLPGDFFGELSALDGGPRSATVIAETPLSAVRLFRRTLMGMAQREPGLTISLLQGIARRIREIEHPMSA